MNYVMKTSIIGGKKKQNTLQQTTAIVETTMEDKLSEKLTVLEEIEPGLFTGFEDTTALEDQKRLTIFSRYSGRLLYY